MAEEAGMSISTGEATIRLLAEYGVDTVFGIPGVHTLEFCRGLGAGSAVRHIQCRSEMGAGLAADGYARASGRPGVVLTISGPGVTNAATPLGVSWNDSVPVLLISADTARGAQGKGWGVLHEVSDLCAVTRPLTAFSARAMRSADLPELLARAFGGFGAARPRPAHVAIPVDLLEEAADGGWSAVPAPSRPQPAPEAIAEAAARLEAARRPVIIAGGGAVDGAAALRTLAERLGAPIVTTSAGKGVLAEDHPLSLGATLCRPETRALLAEADCLLAAGTELSET
ncbi:MAG: decarboxylase, partial [Alphaproteobacteria bacterium]